MTGQKKPKNKRLEDALSAVTKAESTILQLKVQIITVRDLLEGIKADKLKDTDHLRIQFALGIIREESLVDWEIIINGLLARLDGVK